MDFEKILKGLGDVLGESKEERKVERTVKVKPEWKKVFNQYTDVAKEAMRFEGEMKFLKKKFWVLIEGDVGTKYDEMQYDEKDGVIKCYGDSEKRLDNAVENFGKSTDKKSKPEKESKKK